MSDPLKHLKIEIEAEERSVSLRHFYTERVESNCHNRFTRSALLLEESQEKTNKKRVSCNSINHPLWRRYLKVSNPQRKRTILKRNGLACVLFVFIKDTWLLRVL